MVGCGRRVEGGGSGPVEQDPQGATGSAGRGETNRRVRAGQVVQRHGQQSGPGPGQHLPKPCTSQKYKHTQRSRVKLRLKDSMFAMDLCVGVAGGVEEAGGEEAGQTVPVVLGEAGQEAGQGEGAGRGGDLPPQRGRTAQHRLLLHLAVLRLPESGPVGNVG